MLSKISFWFVLFFLGATYTQAQDFLVHGSPQDEGFELYEYQFTFSNGSQAWLTYSLVTLPAIGKKVAAELSFTRWKGKNKHYAVGKQFEPKEWKENAQAQTIDIRKNYWMHRQPGSNHQVHFSTTKGKDYYLDLTFTSAVPGGPATIDKIDGNKFGMIVHIPQGNVQGRIAIGKDTLTVQGKGSLIHTWHKKRITDFVKHTLTLFNHDSGSALAGRLVTSKKDNQVFGHVIHIENDKPQIWKARSLKISKKKADIIWVDQNSPLTIDYSHPTQRYSALSTVDSWIERQAAKLVMGGDIQLLRGDCKTPLGKLSYVAVAP